MTGHLFYTSQLMTALTAIKASHHGKDVEHWDTQIERRFCCIWVLLYALNALMQLYFIDYYYYTSLLKFLNENYE